MRLILIGAALLALGVAGHSPALAEKAASATTGDTAAKAAGLRLAKALYSEQAQVDMAVRLVDTQLGPMFRNNDDFKALEGKHPGYTDAVLAEFKVALARYTRESLPGYYDRVASLIASHLDAAEIDDLAAFYRTPTGQKLLRGVSENMTAESVLAEVEADPDRPTSLSAVTKDHKAAAEAAAKLVDKTDEAALIALAQKPYFARAQAIIPKMRKLEQDFMNEPAPEFENDIERIVKDTIARFEAQEKAK